MKIKCPCCGEEIVVSSENMTGEEIICPVCEIIGVIEIKWRDPELEEK